MSSVTDSASKEQVADFHRAIVQILLAYRCLAEEELTKYIDFMKSDFVPSNYSYGLRDTFTAINKDLRELSLEIKSVAVKKNRDEGDGFVYFHGIVNNEEDQVARDHGNYFEAIELKYFSSIITRLLTANSFSTTDITAFKPSATWSNSRAHDFIAKLETDRWLSRDHRSHFVIGPRTYLELRGYLETSLSNKQGEDGDAEDEKDDDEHFQALLQTLPSIILY